METPQTSTKDLTSGPGTPSEVQLSSEAPPSSKDADSPGATLSFNRIKKMMKQEGVKAVTGEASFVLARATELFLEEIAARAGKTMVADNRRLLAYKDVAGTVQNWSSLEFLKDIVPQKVKASVLMEQALQAVQRDGGGPLDGGPGDH